MKLISHKSLIRKAMKDPEYRRIHYRTQPRYSVANRIYELRKGAGLTQAQLARKAGYKTVFVKSIESTEIEAPLKTIVRLAEALNCHVEIRIVKNKEPK